MASAISVPMPPRALLPVPASSQRKVADTERPSLPPRQSGSPKPIYDSSEASEGSSDSVGVVPQRPPRAAVRPTPQPVPSPRSGGVPLPPRSQVPLQFARPGSELPPPRPSQPIEVASLIDFSDDTPTLEPIAPEPADPFCTHICLFVCVCVCV